MLKNIKETADFIKKKTNCHPKIGIILGTGLGQLVSEININHYIDRAHGKEQVESIHPLLNEVLKETHGIIVYQEQVMEIAQVLSGYSLGEADLLRRAMGKKKPEEMAKQKQRFLDGWLCFD